MSQNGKGSVIKFESPSTITIVGASNSGKTTLVKKLLEQSEGIFTEPISNILYCYGGNSWQPIYDDMMRNIANINFKEGVPNDSDLNELTNRVAGSHVCLVLDDISRLLHSDTKLESLWTAKSHHMFITIVYLTHNLFEKSPIARTCSLSTKYFILFENLRDSLQIKHFARQVYPSQVPFFYGQL